MWNWREREDEKLLEDILRTSVPPGSHQHLLIMDLRHYTAALANKAAKGGGYEYEGTGLLCILCIYFCGIINFVDRILWTKN